MHILLLSLACTGGGTIPGDTGAPPDGAALEDTDTADTGAADTALDDSAPGDTAPADTGGPEDTGEPGETGSGDTGEPGETGDADDDRCPFVSGLSVLGYLEDEAVDEASGLAVSGDYPGVVWTHNDSGDAPTFYALSTDGALLGSWTLELTPPGDWEDMSIERRDGEADRLYLGDVGDNPRTRKSVVVYRVAEPDPYASAAGGDTGEGAPAWTASDFETFELVYPEEPYDAEAMMVDPLTGDLYLVSKNRQGGGESHVHRKAAPHVDGETATLEYITTLDFASAPLAGALVTAGDISPDGSQILIRTYDTAYAWLREEPTDLPAAFAGDPCPLDLPPEPQGETIAYAPDGAGYYSLSEGEHQPIWFAGLE